MTQLSVNINKVALLRNARGGNIPDLVQFAVDCQEFGAQGITVHPRPDERHIRYADLSPLREAVRVEFNIEGFPSEHFLEKVLAIQPDQCTLVPDPPGVLTSDTGWDMWGNLEFLQQTVHKLQGAGIRTSLFCNPILRDVEGAKETGTDRIEFYTGQYASQFEENKEEAIAPHIAAGIRAAELGIEVNAGHDLNLKNLQFYAKNMPMLKEVSIGQALIADALYYGIANTIQMYRRLLV